MPAQFFRVASVNSAIAVLLFAATAYPMPPESPNSMAPQTFPSFYNDMIECMTYFRFMRDALDASGAPRADVTLYGDRAMALFWLHSSIGSRLSRSEMKKALSERAAEKRMRKLATADAMHARYDARCTTLHDNYDEYVHAIERRLELASGEPYIDLKGKCVTLSSDWLAITGRYFGMFGPSIKPVPPGGLPPLDFGSDDRYRIALALGNSEYWNAVEIPTPPKLHEKLLTISPEQLAQLLSRPFANYGIVCGQPHDPYFRGVDTLGRAWWAVACEGGDAFSVFVDHDDGIYKSYRCNEPGGIDNPECFAPCARSSCYTLDPKIDATYEDFRHVPSARVEAAPEDACPTNYGALGMSNRYQLPRLKAGDKHRLSMTIVDPPFCDSMYESGQRTLEILATRRLDMLEVDIAQIEVPPLRLDRSAGPPCELVHINPSRGFGFDSNTTADTFADLRCRLTGNPDDIRTAGPELAVLGRFKNGDPFEGRVAVCERHEN